MTGEYLVIAVKVMQTLQRAQHGREIATLKVAAAALVTEQRIAGEQAVADPDDGRAGRMTGRCHIGCRHAAERHLGSLIRQNIRRILHIIACQSAELTHVVAAQQPGVLLRHNILCAGGFEYLVRRQNVVKMRVRQQHILDIQLFLVYRVQNRLGIVARINHRGFAGCFVIYNVTIRADHAYTKLQQFHSNILSGN